MHRLSPEDIIAVWEQGIALSPVDRAMAILGLACPGASREELGSLTIGRRDVRLFSIYRHTFQPVLYGASTCPGCQETVEFEFDTGNIEPAGDHDGDTFVYSANGFSARYRLPNSFDLGEVLAIGDHDEMRRALLQRCVIEANKDGMPVPADLLPEGLVRDMAERDPHAEILVGLRCPACGREWLDMLDIVSFLWSDISSEARRLLYEVHALASTYGWSEKDILNMSPVRRRFYMGLIG